MKLTSSCIALGLALAAFAAPLHAQSLRGATTATTTGSWSVMRLSDVNACVGVLKRDEAVRITPTSLKVPIRGLIMTIALRYGDKPARAARNPSATETELNAVVLSGPEFTEALQSGRVRVQVQTFGRGMVTEDIDLDGASAAVDALQSSCPAVAAAPVAAPAPAAATAAPAAPATAGAAAAAAPAATAAAGAAATTGTTAAATGAATPRAAATGATSAQAAATGAVAPVAATAPAVAAPPMAAPAPRPAGGGAGLCPQVVVDRMRAEGLRETQIFIICR